MTADAQKHPMEYMWYLPSNRRGDATKLGTGKVEIKPTLDHLVRVAQTAEANGLTNMLIPCNTECSDGWLLASAIAMRTTTFRFCVAFRPGLTSPTFAVQQANTLEMISNGRLTVNVVPGGSSVDQKRYGDHLDHDERYARAMEFLDVAKALWNDPEGRVNYKGRHYDIRDAVVYPPPVQPGGPPVYFGGSSDASRRVVAKHADVFLKWGEPAEQVREEYARLRKIAREEFGRDLRLGMRMHLLVREDGQRARREAESILEGTEMYGGWSGDNQKYGRRIGQEESVSQARMDAMTRDGKIWHGKAVFAGINLVRRGAGTMLVGDPEVVAEAIAEYIDAGATTFIFSGWPHDKEAERFGRLLRPLLPDEVELPAVAGPPAGTNGAEGWAP